MAMRMKWGVTDGAARWVLLVLVLLWSPAVLAGVNEDLIAAATQGDLARVQDFVAKGADVNARDSNGRSALMWASTHGHLAVVRALLDAKADVNAKGDYSTALIWASGEGHLAVVRTLLDGKADINAMPDGGLTALMRAALFGRLAVVQELLARGADVTSRANGEKTAAMFAADGVYPNTVALLTARETRAVGKTSKRPVCGASGQNADRVVLKDAAMLMGEIKAKKAPFQSSFGKLEVDFRDVESFCDGILRLVDGTVLKGRFSGDSLTLVTRGEGDVEVSLDDVGSIDRVDPSESQEARMVDAYDALVRGTKAELAKRSAQLARGMKLSPFDQDNIFSWVADELKPLISTRGESDKVGFRIISREIGNEVIAIRKPPTNRSPESAVIIESKDL